MPDKIIDKKLSADTALELAKSFMDSQCRGEEADLAIIDQLAHLALSPVPTDAASGTKALYSIIIERLCDDFSSSGVRLCNMVLLRLLAMVRSLPEGRRINELLNRLNYKDSKDLLDRYQRVEYQSLPAALETEKVKKIFILSRVTVGADVEITSVMVQRLHQYFVNAALVIIGPRHLNEIFYNLNQVSCLLFNYTRQGTLSERLEFWPDLYFLIQQQCRGLAQDEFFLFDPDSRLSQLGLLPLLPERNTCYFNSRQDQPAADNNLSLSRLANKWLDIILHEHKSALPMVANCPTHEEAARVFFKQFHQSSFITSANLGVGGDSRKRVVDPFEEELVFALLEQPDTILFLDSGSTLEEKMRIEKLTESAKNRGMNTAAVNENELDTKKINFSHGVINFSGGVSSLIAVIRQSNVFLGYDSCCQHLATSLGLPSVIVFAGAPNQRFLRRWQPGNPEGVTITIPVEKQPRSTEITELVKKVVIASRKVGRIIADQRN